VGRTLPESDVEVAVLVRTHAVEAPRPSLLALPLCRRRRRRREVDQRPPARKLDGPTREVIVDHFELGRGRVDKVEEAVVGREGETVGDGQVGDEQVRAPVRMEAEEVCSEPFAGVPEWTGPKEP